MSLVANKYVNWRIKHDKAHINRWVSTDDDDDWDWQIAISQRANTFMVLDYLQPHLRSQVVWLLSRLIHSLFELPMSETIFPSLIAVNALIVYGISRFYLYIFYLRFMLRRNLLIKTKTFRYSSRRHDTERWIRKNDDWYRKMWVILRGAYDKRKC